MNIKPIGDRVLLKVVESETKTAGGIFIPDTAQEKTQEATVIQIGDSSEIIVKVGDKVIYDKYSGSNIGISGDDYIILKQENILAIIN